MAFKPILKQIYFVEETNSVVMIVDHVDGKKILTRSYERKMPATVTSLKTFVIDANQLLNNINKPSVVTTLEDLIDSEIK